MISGLAQLSLEPYTAIFLEYFSWIGAYSSLCLRSSTEIGGHDRWDSILTFFGPHKYRQLTIL